MTPPRGASSPTTTPSHSQKQNKQQRRGHPKRRGERPREGSQRWTVPATTITNHQNISRRPIPGRRRTLSQTSTAAPLPLEDGSNRSLDLDTVSEGTDETGFSENKRPRTSEFPVTSSPEKEVLEPTDSSETMPSVSSAISDAAIESVNRNRMLDFWKDDLQEDSSRTRHRERTFSIIGRASCSPFFVGTWYYLTTDSCSSDEVYPKHLSPDERVAFEIADAAEWKAIVDIGSVKVLNSEVANAIRKEQPDRVINSRMVRRLKPQEGTFQKPKAKSRWCVLGHQDPDAADMFTCAPTPQTESIMMFLFLLQLCSLTLSIADLKNAFCQSDSLDRSAGPLFVEPCEGLDLPPGSLIQLIARCTVSTMPLFDGIVP